MEMVDGQTVNYDTCPGHVRGPLERYIENHIQPGGFLTAFLSNDLMGALGRADSINKHQLLEIAQWLYQYAPSACYGSEERVRSWLNR